MDKVQPQDNSPIYQQLDSAPLESPLQHNQTNNNFLKLFFVSFLIITIAFLATGGILVAAAYSPEKLSFIPSSMRINANRFLLELPVPRNTEQIFLGTLLNESHLKQYKQKMFLELSTQGVPKDSPLSGSIALRADGPIDATDKTSVKLDQKIVLLAQLLDNTYKMQGQIIATDVNLFLKIDDLPQEVQAYMTEYTDPHKVLNKWLQLDTKQLEAIGSNYLPLDKTTASDKQSTKVGNPSLDKFVKNIFTFTIQSNYYDYLNYLGQEDINGIPTYHIQLNESGTNLKPYLSGLIDYIIENVPDEKEEFNESRDSTLESLDYIDRIIFDIYVDANNYYIVRSNVDVVITPPLNMIPTVKQFSTMYGIDLSSNLKINLKAGWEASDINIPHSIIAPKEVTPFDFTETFSEKQRFTKKDEQTKKDLESIGQALNKYHDKYKKYPASLDELVKEGILDKIPSNDSLPYEYYSKDNNAYVFGYLYAPSDYTKPLWKYDAHTNKGKAITYEEYSSIEGDTQILPSKEDTGGDVNGMFDLNLGNFLKESILKY